MERQTLTKEIEITAPAHIVWKTLFSADTYSKWAAVFSDGAKFETDWKEGSKVVFSDDNNDGLIGTITKNEGGRFLSIEYSGELEDGVEDYESEGAILMKGGIESYTLTETEGEEGMSTILVISTEVPSGYVKMMDEAWDKALPLIKELSEIK